MRKNHVQSVILHMPDEADLRALSDRVTEFHLAVIECRLGQSALTEPQQMAVIDHIIENIRRRELGDSSP